MVRGETIEILFEILLQLALELGLEGLLRAAPFDTRARTAATTLFAAMAGAAIGAGTVVVYPRHFITQPELRLVNLVITPLVVSACMVWLGGFMRRRDRMVGPLEHFLPAYAFAIGLAAVRFVAVD